MTAGRPTICNDELREKALEYIENYREHGEVIPSVVGMAKAINVAKSTLYKWAEEEDKKFSDILDQCMDNQEIALMNGGLSGDYNSTITKLMLTKHGYHDKADNTLSSPDGGPVNISFNGVKSDGSRTN